MSTTATLAIRTLGPAQLDALMDIERRAFGLAWRWSRAMLAAELAWPGSVNLGAYEGDELVGYIFCEPDDDQWYLTNVAVEASRRQCGVASQLLARLLELTAGSHRRYRLEVDAENVASLALCEKFGFERRGRIGGQIVLWRDAA